jgi:hypothetical protein
MNLELVVTEKNLEIIDTVSMNLAKASGILECIVVAGEAIDSSTVDGAVAVASGLIGEAMSMPHATRTEIEITAWHAIRKAICICSAVDGAAGDQTAGARIAALWAAVDLLENARLALADPGSRHED